jgi:hypothetical protein
MLRKLGVGVIAVGMAACSNPFATDGQSDVALIMGAINGGTPLKSDVLISGAIQPDLVSVVLAARSKNIRFNTTQYTRGIQLTRYEISFYRSDGRNTQGVDVPHDIAGDLSAFVDIGEPAQNVTLSIEIVRAQAKIEPPLKNLEFNNATNIFSCFARVTIYGTQLASGDIVSATGAVQIDFADWADSGTAGLRN